MKSLLVALILFVAAPAFGIIYSWTDSKGITHYTNKEYEIPARYKSKVKARFPEAADTGAPQPNQQTSTAPPASQPSVLPGKPEAQPPVVGTGTQDNVTPRRARRERRVRTDDE